MTILIPLFVGLLIFGLTLMPALFNLVFFVFTTFMIAFILYFRISRKNLIIVMILASIVEFILGYQFGTYISSILFTILILLVLEKSINLPSLKNISLKGVLASTALGSVGNLMFDLIFAINQSFFFSDRRIVLLDIFKFKLFIIGFFEILCYLLIFYYVDNELWRRRSTKYR